MSTLPPLDTTDVGPIAYWNALDHGASELNPADLLTYLEVDTWEEYDNGIRGDFRENGLSYRVKTDGWIVIYRDVGEVSVQPDSWVMGYSAESPPSDLVETTLSREINNFRKEASNASEMDFNHADVGLYDYRYEGASQALILSLSVIGDSDQDITQTGVYAYSSGSGGPYIYKMKAYAQGEASIDFEGTEIAHTNTETGDRTTVELSGDINTAGKEYNTKATGESDPDDFSPGEAYVTTFVIE